MDKPRLLRRSWAFALCALFVATAVLAAPGPANAAQGCHIDPSWHISLIAADDSVAAAEFGWTGDDKGILHARTAISSIGPWERFLPVCVNGPGEVYALQSAYNGKYVSAELGWTGDRKGLLRARSDTIGPWEQFQINFINNGNDVALKSMANKLYVSAELGWTGTSKGELRAREGTIGAWETFGIWLS